MLHKLEQPTFIEFVEKVANICVKNVVHSLLFDCDGQRIQRIVLAAPRPEPVGEAEKVFLINLVEDGNRGLLDDLVFQRRDS